MIEEAGGPIDYEERGSGPTVVLVPGSCSTGAAWRPVVAAWGERFRTVTTSLLGYGGTAERRTAEDTTVAHEAEVVEAVVRRAGGRVHLVGHSFGGLVSLAVALRGRVPLASLTVLEAPALELLRLHGDAEGYAAMRGMADGYLAAFAAGEAEAVARMIDFYGGPGTFAAWPPRVRAYAVETTPVNRLDWLSAFDFAPDRAALAQVTVPVLVVHGGDSHPAVRRANALIAAGVSGADLAAVAGATHFMIATHAIEVARRVAAHVDGAGSA